MNNWKIMLTNCELQKIKEEINKLHDFAEESGIQEDVDIFSNALEHYLYNVDERKGEELIKKLKEARSRLKQEFTEYKEKQEAIKKVIDNE